MAQLGDPVQYLQIFALILSGWAVVIQITLRRMESVGFIRGSESYLVANVWGLIYSVVVIWLVCLSAVLFYRATEAIQTAIRRPHISNQLYKSMNFALEGLVLLIVIVLVAFIYGCLNEMIKEESLLLASVLLLWDAVVYLAVSVSGNQINGMSVLPTEIPTLFGLLIGNALGRSGITPTTTVALVYTCVISFATLITLLTAIQVNKWEFI